MKTKILPLKNIDINYKLYPRVQVSEALIREYAKAMKKGDIFPPLSVALIKGKHWLIDGKHRMEALKSNGEEYTQCEIRTIPNFQELFLASVRTNVKHGRRLTKSDKWKIAFKLKAMNIVTIDINKLVGIEVNSLETSFSKKLSHVIMKDKIRKGQVPEMRETIHPSEKGNVEVVSEAGVMSKEEIEMNQEYWQESELDRMYTYLKNETLLFKKPKIKTMITKIKKLLNKIYPKL